MCRGGLACSAPDPEACAILPPFMAVADPSGKAPGIQRDTTTGGFIGVGKPGLHLRFAVERKGHDTSGYESMRSSRVSTDVSDSLPGRGGTRA